MNLQFLKDKAWPYRRELASISSLSLLSSLATLAIPWLAGQVLAGVITDDAVDLGILAMLLLAALLTLTALNIIVAIVSGRAAGLILAGLRRDAYDHIQAMPMSFHDSNKAGDLLSLMTFEVGNLSGFLTATLANVPSMVLTATGAIILLFLIDPAITLLVPVVVALFYLVMKLIGRKLRSLAETARKAQSELVWAGARDLDMLPAIKSFATEDHHRAQYHTAIERARLLNLKQIRITAFIGPLVALVAALAAIAILLSGSSQIASGVRSPADLLSFLLYAALLTRPAGALANTYGQWQIAKGTLARLEEVFAQPAEDGYTHTKTLGRARGAISFENIDFCYSGRAPVLQGFDLHIAAGEVVALTGDNGIGKSTLVNLLLRFYDPQSGKITLDGTDIGTLQVQDLRRQFGYVPQRALLFDGSVRDNIAFGLDSPDPQALERAARMAQAWEFITDLPLGLDTHIGDDGVRLSGGQRQRIALARALLRDPPVYIFDEATSMYDLEGEAAFVEACLQLLTDRTVIIITHRPASLALADRIVTMSPSGHTITAGRRQASHRSA
jgi:ATP-binding cassette subfamily B protein/subfamily B ATP-binding cassette protein MsbA